MESGEAFAEEMQVELQGLSEHIKSKKKRDQKVAQKQKGQDNFEE